MPAFQSAVELGYRYLETDVHVTRDGVLLAFHDETLDRMTDATGRIEELDYAEVKQARIAGEFPIPLFEEVLGSWPDVKVNIDPKSDAAVEPLITALRRADVLHRVCIGSFSNARLDKVRAAFGDKVCTSMGPWDIIKLRAASLGVPLGESRANCVQAPLRRRGMLLVDAHFVAAAKERGLPIHVWTINEVEDMEALIDLGVDGLITDYPGRLKDLLITRNLWG